MELQFRTYERLLDSPRRYLHKIKTTKWIVSTLSHVVTKQALGENFKYRKFPLEKETLMAARMRCKS